MQTQPRKHLVSKVQSAKSSQSQQLFLLWKKYCEYFDDAWHTFYDIIFSGIF